ncbi:MAG: metal-dependent transcriptional regulator [Thermoanaerobaculales bacterium]|nr:metal-dependent transcriptional regulator [Thermoanaerobaculales bacterium]
MNNLESIHGEADRPALTESQEDYLKQILLLQERRGKAGTKELANRLRVRPASVTEMMGRLAQLGLVEHVRYQGVTLTPSGRRVALEMLRHHRLLETYLVRELGYSWDQVHEEADRLEHVISERFDTRIAEAMGHPTHDPHGDPIPGVDLQMPPDEKWVRLDALASGDRGELVRVGAQDRDSLNSLQRLGVALGCPLEVIESDETSVCVRMGRNRQVLPVSLARRLWVERKNV